MVEAVVIAVCNVLGHCFTWKGKAIVKRDPKHESHRCSVAEYEECLAFIWMSAQISVHADNEIRIYASSTAWHGN